MANLYNNCPNQGSCDDASDATNCNMSGTCTGNSTDGTKNCDDYAEKNNVNVLTSTINGSDGTLASAGDDTEYLYVSDEQVAMTSTSTSLQLFPNADGYQYELAGGNSEICEVTSDGNILFKESGYIMVDVYNDEGELVGRYGVSLYYNDSGTNTLVVGKVCCYDEKTDTPATVEPTAIGLELIPNQTTMIVGSERTIIATVTPTGASQEVIFSSSDTDVATVTEDGIVTAVGIGTAQITVQSAAKASVCNIISIQVTMNTVVEDGNYYINNKATGKYLKYNSTPSVVSGKTYDLGLSIVWEVENQGDGYVTIKPLGNINLCLAIDDSNGIVLVPQTEFTDRCLWRLTISGGLIIQNQASEGCLTVSNDRLLMLDKTEQCIWRIAEPCRDTFGNFYDAEELPSDFRIDDMTLEVSEQKRPSVDSEFFSLAHWCSGGDFVYSEYEKNIIDINSDDGTITAIDIGSTIVKATHKVTRQETRFMVNVDFNRQQVFDAIEELYNYARLHLGEAATVEKCYMLAMQYIRRFRYNGFLWDFTAGNIDQGFISYVDGNSTIMQELFGNENKINYFCDANGVDVDLYHLCATLNALFYVECYPSLATELGQNLAGWAGDLQQMIPSVFETIGAEATDEEIYNYVLKQLQDGTLSAFTNDDLVADLDAFCIYTGLKNIVLDKPEQYMSYYYTYDFNDRFVIFAGHMGYRDIQQMVQKYLDMPLVLGDFIILTTAQRCAFRDAFVDYIWETIHK